MLVGTFGYDGVCMCIMKICIVFIEPINSLILYYLPIQEDLKRKKEQEENELKTKFKANPIPGMMMLRWCDVCSVICISTV